MKAAATAQIAHVHDTLQSFQQHRRLVALVNTMAHEIERLDEENNQLRAAISLYRELLNRSEAATPARAAAAGS